MKGDSISGKVCSQFKQPLPGLARHGTNSGLNAKNILANRPSSVKYHIPAMGLSRGLYGPPW
ncbi:hypothetical protein DCCM_4693 [Desulfocucumis palustris]|uniref:Uncharacterized protein n=1 Tax=Desulfocucumis palustris TaxID=1898651 RepID=A0A2L2XHV7_9FIRM|nr:hypothetical protein DCCM_4693 [Desulfocucumis palustris]